MSPSFEGTGSGGARGAEVRAQLDAQRVGGRSLSRGEKDRVVAGDRARDARVPALVYRLCKRARVARRRGDDNEWPGRLDARRVAAHRDADRADAVRVVRARRCVDETAGRRAHLRQPELVDVARDRRLHDVVALVAERVDELRLRGDRAIADETQDRLVAHGVPHASTSRRTTSASATSASETTSGGSR